MKKIIITLSLLAACTCAMQAQLLWKISGAGLEKPSWLFGTHHIAPVAVIDSVPGFAEALAAADIVCGEMEMAAAQSPASQQTIMMAAMAPSDSTLSRVLTIPQLDSINTTLKKYMGPMADIRTMESLKPAMVATALAMVQAQAAFPQFNPAEQLDLVIQQRAQKAGKQVAGLETVEQQASILFGSPIAQQAAELMEAIRHDDSATAFSTRLASAYLSGDLDAMLSLMEDPVCGMGQSADRLINSRNADWLRVIAGLVPTASVLIAVGAGHLPGEKGLIALLRDKGYTVEPVE